jgi:hypothetical protein
MAIFPMSGVLRGFPAASCYLKCICIIFKDFNMAAERITGLKRDQIVGKDAEKIFPGLKDAGLIGAFQQVWETGKTTHHPLSLFNS